jgi:CarD family transcriptional regulator
MQFRIGQRVAYPNQGVGVIEAIGEHELGGNVGRFYSLKLNCNDTVVRVPTERATGVGLRPIINSVECEKLMRRLAGDFEPAPSDWKKRFRLYSEKMQSGNVFQVADVLKGLSYVSLAKPLSFRDNKMLEKAKYLVVSEMAIVCSQPECNIEEKVDQLLALAFQKHAENERNVASAVGH